jgi:hypothetical protein
MGSCEFSRPNVMGQVTDIHDLALPTLLPGSKVNTAPDNYRPIQATICNGGPARTGSVSAA